MDLWLTEERNLPAAFNRIYKLQTLIRRSLFRGEVHRTGEPFRGRDPQFRLLLADRLVHLDDQLFAILGKLSIEDLSNPLSDPLGGLAMDLTDLVHPKIQELNRRIGHLRSKLDIRRERNRYQLDLDLTIDLHSYRRIGLSRDTHKLHVASKLVHSTEKFQRCDYPNARCEFFAIGLDIKFLNLYLQLVGRIDKLDQVAGPCPVIGHFPPLLGVDPHAIELHIQTVSYSTLLAPLAGVLDVGWQIHQAQPTRPLTEFLKFLLGRTGNLVECLGQL